MDAKEPTNFDTDGRDPVVVKLLQRHAELTGQQFCREDVPPGLSIADFWQEVEQRGELITAQRWLILKRNADAALRQYAATRAVKFGPEFSRFMQAALAEIATTSSERSRP